jgi:hypothetical protein
VLPELVELMATSRDEAVSAASAVAAARDALAAVPDGAVSQVVSLRDALSGRIERYAPMLDAYVDASDRLPAILGWDGPRRYLVLTQDPAELRPTGGFIGSYGTVAFDRGTITEFRFQDASPLDIPWDYRRIDPPQELSDYLLGPKQPWQFADSNWSPDFPTAAQDALRLYVNESGDARIDGVLAITTFTIDELLKTTGPISVPEYGVTVASGETTLKILQQTRVAPTGEDRKAFLPTFADRLRAGLEKLPPGRWGSLVGAADALGRAHLLLVWFRHPADQALAERTRFAGAVRQDPGDYLYAVDANVAPATKLDYWTSRGADLDVRIDGVGNVRHTLTLTWDNRVETADGAPYRAMTNVGGHVLGLYSRILVPERSRVESVRGSGPTPVTDPAVVEEEAARSVFGVYLRVPPGTATLAWAWTSPYAADADETGGTYRLTIQHQPGLLPGPLELTIRVPGGMRITAASPELTVAGDVATLRLSLDRDLVVGIRYAP